MNYLEHYLDCPLFLAHLLTGHECMHVHILLKLYNALNFTDFASVVATSNELCVTSSNSGSPS